VSYMCEIQLIARFGGQITPEDTGEMVRLLKDGGEINSDAWGWFTSTELHKQIGNKIRAEKFRVHDTWFLAGHNRFATQGDAQRNRNNHPFVVGNFVCLHNGIINNVEELCNEFHISCVSSSYEQIVQARFRPMKAYKKRKKGKKSKRHKEEEFSLPESSRWVMMGPSVDGIETDSYIIPKITNQLCVEEHLISVEAFKKTLEKLKGSYSILLYCKHEDKLLYAKNSKTSFHFALNKDNVLVASTSLVNLAQAYSEKRWVFNIDSKVYTEPSDNIIYEIASDGIFPIDEFESKSSGSEYKSVNFNPGSKWSVYGDY